MAEEIKKGFSNRASETEIKSFSSANAETDARESFSSRNAEAEIASEKPKEPKENDS